MRALPCDRGRAVPTARQVPAPRGICMRSIYFALLVVAQADLSFKAFTRDPQGYASHIRLVDGSQIEYFSDEFNELCTQMGANPVPANNPLGAGCDVQGGSCVQGISQRFQHPQVRTIDDQQRAALPDRQYLDDGQLDNPYSGRVSSGNYTEVVTTKEFIPDGDLLPLPHTRTQLCHYALRLTQPVSAQNSAAWSRFKQLVSYGFETEFHFRVYHRTKECWVGEWCEAAGADGFAFVIQNEGRKIVGNDISGNGYGFRYSLAIEFDMYRNPDLGELSGNHISVHVPPRKGEPNSADHRISSIAYTDDIPPLQEGTHVVRIVYDVRNVRWDRYGTDFDSDATGDFLRLQHSGRAGLLSVELDGRRVIVVPVDLSYIVNVDGTSKAAANTPRQPDPEAYDEKGASPGRAWVGFSSSTSYFQFQSVDILSWTFQEYAACPIDGVQDSRATVRGQGPEVHCIIRMGTIGRSTCTWDGRQNCSLIIQNAGRSAVKISAHTSHHLPHEYEGCDNGVLEWDGLHPWFLGCRRTVRFTHELQELWITSLDGVRALKINDQQILQKSPVLFKRESLFQYCVMEHKHDPFSFYFAECNCAYCMRLLSISNLYNILYQHQCSARYGLFCPCFEASEVQHDSSTWTTLEPLRHMRIHICRGCAYTSHCAKMLKVATCEVSDTGYQLGNPFAPTILQNGFINTSLDGDRVPTGYLRGDACNCEPQVRPYIGDDQGRSGQCSEQSNLGSGTFADLFGCADLCRQTARCSFLTYWESTQECRIYKECFWELCTNDYCFQSSTYRNEALGDYLTLRGYVQEFTVFPRRTLQTNFEDCKSCLHLYDHIYCLHQCGNPDLRPYLHWPAGQACSTCIFAGNRMHEMNMQQTQIVKDCVYEAIRNSQDPWVACDQVAIQQSGAAAFDLFNGVSTHFLSECPGRGFAEVGAVCVPNLYAMQAFPLQVLSRMAAINDTVWGTDLQCLNAVCEIVPQWMCYQRWIEWLLNTDTQSNGVISINNTVMNNAELTPSAVNLLGELIPGYLMLNKSMEQFLVSDPVNLETENATLEAWIRLGEVEEIKNMVLNVPASSNSDWSEDYHPRFACDGIPETYWSSQVGIEGIPTLQASLWLDLDGFQNGGAVIITWKEPAADYSVWVSLDNVSWWNIITVENNQDTYSYHQAFFGAHYLRLDMTRAAATRGPGIDAGKPVFSIYELEVKRDTNVARLQQTMIFNYFNKPASSAVDGDNLTYWATEIGTPAAEFHIDLGSSQQVLATRVSWRFRPLRVTVYVGPNPCSDGLPAEQYHQLADVQVRDEFELTRNWQGRCMVIAVEETRSFFGERYVGIREVELFTDGNNLSPSSTVNSSYPGQEFHLTALSNCLDGDASTYFLVQPQETPTSITVDLGAEYKVMSFEIRFARINNEDYFASGFYTEMATQLDVWFTVDFQQGSRAMVHYVKVYQNARFVRFVFEQVFGLNPQGRLGIEDLIIRRVSDNLAQGSSVTVAATNSFAGCSKCAISYDGSFRPRDGAFAVDDDFETWFGTQYGLTDFNSAYLQITFTRLTQVDLAAIRWKYPAVDIFGLCSQTATGDNDFTTVANVEDNGLYVTPVVFYNSYECLRLRFSLGANLGTLGSEPVIGIREVEIYSTQDDITRDMPVTSSDGTVATFATDSSDVTVWRSTGTSETSLTIDTTSNFTAWGARVLSPSTSVIVAFDVQVSDDGLTFETVYKVQANLNNDLWIIERFSGRFIRFVFLQTFANAYFVRTLRVFATENLALGRETYAPLRWDHSGIEAVDGINETIWLSEPLATSATLRLDLGESTFIAGGLEIFWLYPPTDFGLYLSNDTVTWAMLWQTTGNQDDATKIGCPSHCYWESRYIEIRMTRASGLNGDELYAIRSFNVYFDTNLAHFKPITATKTLQGNPFGPENAIDGDENTFWMPAQVGGPNYITFDMTYDVLFAGFSVNWRRPPVQFYMEYEEADTLIWKMLQRWTTTGSFSNVGYQQDWFEGFPARRVRLVVEEMQQWPEGRVCALTDLHAEVWDRSENLALNRQVIPSEEQILGNLARFAVDGNDRGTYWYPAEGQPQAWIIVQLDPVPPVPGLPPQGWPIGRIIVLWRFPPGDLTLERQLANEEWRVLKQYTGITELRTDWAGMRSAVAIRLTIDKSNVVCNPPDPFCQEIGVMEISVYKYSYAKPTAVEPDPNPWNAAAQYMVDTSQDTYWMGPPLFDGDNIYISVDLGKIYNATDIEIFFGWRAQVVYLSMSEDGVNYVDKGLSSGNVLGLLTLAEKGLTFQVRYVTLWIQRGFQDAETGSWGTAIRDLGVLQFSNIVRGKVPLTNSIWEYPASWTVDDDLNTEWTSRFGALEAQLIYDLGYERNVAGMTWVFGHIAGRVDVHFANRNDNRSNWQRAYQLIGNVATETAVPTTVHFKCRYIRLTLHEPRTREFWAPDAFEDVEQWNSLLSLKDFKAYEHTGGGGVLGFQSVDGMQYSTVTYALRQPGQWILASEEDIVTQDIHPDITFNDVGQIVHIALTKQKVGGTSTERMMEYAVYRNGLTYGRYTVSEPISRMNGPGNVRVVMGVRSSAHYPVPATDPGPTDVDPRKNVIHGVSHNPFFEGWIYNVTLFKNALTAEEVRGLYEVHAQGGQESGCHCYDACPTGANRFFPNVQVPCSGQGACLRTSGQAFAGGRCECNPGYSGNACQNHCSELSSYGCCEVDDDCPFGVTCNVATRSCSQ